MITQSYAETGKLIDFSVLTYSFGKMEVVILGLVGMFVYVMLGYWLKHFHTMVGMKYGMWVQNILYIVYQAMLVVYASAWTLTNKLPPGN